MALTSSAGLIEEQRLFYVAVTRAADDLTLYAPLRMPHHRHARDDKHSFAPVSRFLDEEAMAALDVEDLSPPRPTPRGSARPPGWRCRRWTICGRRDSRTIDHTAGDLGSTDCHRVARSGECT